MVEDLKEGLNPWEVRKRILSEIYSTNIDERKKHRVLVGSEIKGRETAPYHSMMVITNIPESIDDKMVLNAVLRSGHSVEGLVRLEYLSNKKRAEATLMMNQLSGAVRLISGCFSLGEFVEVLKEVATLTDYRHITGGI